MGNESHDLDGCLGSQRLHGRGFRWLEHFFSFLHVLHTLPSRHFFHSLPIYAIAPIGLSGLTFFALNVASSRLQLEILSTEECGSGSKGIGIDWSWLLLP